MTVAAVIKGPNGIFALSDMLISSDNIERQSVTLPFQARPDSYEYFSVPGLAQKILVVNDFVCLLWAGSQLAAKSLFSQLRRISDSERDFVTSCERLRDQFSEEDLDFIICFNFPKSAGLFHHGASHFKSGGIEYWCIGSGEYQFENIAKEIGIECSTTAEVLAKYLGILFTVTQTSSDFLFSRFGGFFEFIECRNGAFRKPSICVKNYFYDNGDLVDPLNLVASTYQDQKTYVCQLNCQKNASVPPFSIFSDAKEEVTRNLITEINPEIWIESIYEATTTDNGDVQCVSGDIGAFVAITFEKRDWLSLRIKNSSVSLEFGDPDYRKHMQKLLARYTS